MTTNTLNKKFKKKPDFRLVKNQEKLRATNFSICVFFFFFFFIEYDSHFKYFN